MKTTQTPSNGEALLTFEQRTIQDLIALEHRRLDIQERRAQAEAARDDLEATHVAQAQIRADAMAALLENALAFLKPHVMRILGIRDEYATPDASGVVNDEPKADEVPSSVRRPFGSCEPGDASFG